MTGSDRRDDPEWPIEAADTERAPARDAAGEGRAPLRFGGEHERRFRYGAERADRNREGRDPIDPRREELDPVRNHRGIHPILLALGGLLLLLLVAWLLTGNRNSNQDKLTGQTASGTAAASKDPEKLCATKGTYDLIKRELFRRAAQVRGSDQAAYDRISASAVVRMDHPVMENEDSSNGAVHCSGSLSLDLPPGIAVVGGRRTLTSDIDYTVQQAADGSGAVVVLQNADPIITPLATLGRVAEPAPATPDATSNDAAPVQGPLVPEPQAPAQAPSAPVGPPAVPSAPPRSTANARPSFNCANARTRGEIAVCGDAGLAALDRQMAAQFGRAMANASPEQQAILERTRNFFLRYRDRCPNRGCIADSYTGRIREIRDIMEGRWRPSR